MLPIDTQFNTKFNTQYCLDCLREDVDRPQPKARGGSYCNHHIHKRSMLSRERAKVKDALLLLRKGQTQVALDILNDQNRYAKPKLSDVVLEEFALKCDERGKSLRTIGINAGREQKSVYQEKIEQEAREAFILRRRRLPTDQEQLFLHAHADPFFEIDMERLETDSRYKGNSSTGEAEQWGPPNGTD